MNRLTKGQQIRRAMYWTVFMAEEYLKTLTPEEYADMIIVGGPDRKTDPCHP